MRAPVFAAKLDAIAGRLPADRPMIDVTPRVAQSRAAIAERLRGVGEGE
jgi:hypothetical protein